MLLGVDIGTSAVKAGVFDLEGHLLGLGRSTCEMDAPQPGWAQCDPELWWNGLVESLAGACAAAGITPDQVNAVGVGVLFPAVMPLDREGRALAPAILYCDQRSLAQVRAIENAVPLEEYQATIGNVLMPGTCAVTSIAWLRDEKPEAYGDAATIGWANTFVVGRLTGEFFTDPSMASLSGLVDISDPWEWSGELCERLNIDRERLPRIGGSGDVVGTVNGPAAEKTGLKPGTPVVCGAGDVSIAAVGAGALSTGSVMYMAGSTDCVASPWSEPTSDRRWMNAGYVPRGMWLGVGSMTSTGVSVEWFAREVLGSAGSEGMEQMTRLATSSAPGGGGLVFLPYLQGERTPIWDPMARGMFVGLTPSTTRAHLARAVFEGTAFGLRHVLESLEGIAGSAVGRIRAFGGCTRNALWNQVKADVLQKELTVLDFQETGTLGAALLAGMGAGHYKSFDEAIAVAKSVAGGHAVSPDSSHAGIYDELFDVYTQCYPATRDVVHALSRKDT